MAAQAKVNDVLGYPIDDFQRRALEVIVDPTRDCLAMAPTGSGKTAVALIAILQAFARGQRAVYTSPIKALSNQKYAEFKEWFGTKAPELGAEVCDSLIVIVLWFVHRGHWRAACIQTTRFYAGAVAVCL